MQREEMTDGADKGKPEKPPPRRAGRQIEVADAWIAATALLYNAIRVSERSR